MRISVINSHIFMTLFFLISQADFTQLMELIQSTVEPNSWVDVGGTGSIASFETNLSLVISQTQEIHEKIADLLDQLRRLQYLQVTIEVRFITLRDDFFEQIGIDRLDLDHDRFSPHDRVTYLNRHLAVVLVPSRRLDLTRAGCVTEVPRLPSIDNNE